MLGLLGNKIDCENRQVSLEEGLQKAEKINALFQECSAKTGEKLNGFFKLVLDTLIKTMGEQPVFAAERERRFVVALDESGLQDEQKSALMGLDSRVMADVFGARENMICMVWAPEESPARKDDDQQDADLPDEGGEAPQEE